MTSSHQHSWIVSYRGQESSLACERKVDLWVHIAIQVTFEKQLTALERDPLHLQCIADCRVEIATAMLIALLSVDVTRAHVDVERAVRIAADGCDGLNEA